MPIFLGQIHRCGKFGVKVERIFLTAKDFSAFIYRLKVKLCERGLDLDSIC
jgi:hypothetical protein